MERPTALDWSECSIFYTQAVDYIVHVHVHCSMLSSYCDYQSQELHMFYKVAVYIDK